VQPVDLLLRLHRQADIRAVEVEAIGRAVPFHQIHPVNLGANAGHDAGVLREGEDDVITISIRNPESVDVVLGVLGGQPRGRAVEPHRPGTAVPFQDVLAAVAQRTDRTGGRGADEQGGSSDRRNVAHRIIGRGRGRVAVAGCVLGLVGADGGDHRTVAGHAADSHIVGRAVVGRDLRYRPRRRPGRAAQRHITRGEAGHRLTEDDRKVDRAAARRVTLAASLIDGHGRVGRVGQWVQFQVNQRQVVVRHAKLVGRVEGGLEVDRLEVSVVVQGVRLVGVNMPLGRARYLRFHGRVGQGVIQVAPLAVEGVGVGVRATELGDQVDVAGRLQRRDRVFLGVAVQVTDDQHVGVARSGRVRAQPGDQLVDGVGAHGVAVALAVAGIRRVTGAALALQVVGDNDELRTGSHFLKGLGQRRPVARRAVATVDEGDRV